MVTDNSLPPTGDNRNSRPDQPVLPTPEPNQFEHFLSADTTGSIGAKGSHVETAIRMAEVRRVDALVFDLDRKHLTPSLANNLLAYLQDVLPELELRQTSSDGNLHAIIHFDSPIPLNDAEELWQVLKKLLLNDPSASLLAKARVVGSLKWKPGGDRYRVRLIRAGTSVCAKSLLKDLTHRPVDGNGDAEGAAEWKRRQHRALLTRLSAPNGQPYWDGSSSHGICPIQGTGNNATQYALAIDYASGTCFGDCSENGSPRRIPLAQILKARAISADSWSRFAVWFEESSATTSGRPIVEHNSFRPLDEYYSTILLTLANTGRFFRYGNHLAEIRHDKLKPLTTPDEFVGAVTGLMEIAVQQVKGRKYIRFKNGFFSRICG